MKNADWLLQHDLCRLSTERLPMLQGNAGSMNQPSPASQLCAQHAANPALQDSQLKTHLAVTRWC